MDERRPHSTHQRRKVGKALWAVCKWIRTEIWRIEVREAVAVNIVKDERHLLPVRHSKVIGNTIRDRVEPIAVQRHVGVFGPLLRGETARRLEEEIAYQVAARLNCRPIVELNWPGEESGISWLGLLG